MHTEIEMEVHLRCVIYKFLFLSFLEALSFDSNHGWLYPSQYRPSPQFLNRTISSAVTHRLPIPNQFPPHGWNNRLNEPSFLFLVFDVNKGLSRRSKFNLQLPYAYTLGYDTSALGLNNFCISRVFLKRFGLILRNGDIVVVVENTV